jgi:hypothetical protein
VAVDQSSKEKIIFNDVHDYDRVFMDETTKNNKKRKTICSQH